MFVVVLTMVTGLMEPKLRMYSSQCTVVALSAGNRNKPKSIPAKPSPRIKFHWQRLASDEIKKTHVRLHCGFDEFYFTPAQQAATNSWRRERFLLTNHETSGQIFKSKRHQIFPRVRLVCGRNITEREKIIYAAVRFANRFYFTRKCTERWIQLYLHKSSVIFMHEMSPF